MATAGSSARRLRVALVASFLVAFPLCIAHGVKSNSPVPAVGLVPLGTSAAAALFFLLYRPRRSEDEGAGESADRAAEETEDNELSLEARRPILVFLLDAAHAVALIVVLVFTWIHPRKTPALSMLAAYATIPLLVAFFIHLYLAVSAFYTGFAIRDLMQYVAWQAVPPHCPNCSHRLRPESTPQIPWFQSQSGWKLTMPAMPSMPSMPAITAPEWKMPAMPAVPAWLQGRGGEERLFVAEEDRYRDYPEGGEPSATDQPEPVDVVRKGRSMPVHGLHEA